MVMHYAHQYAESLRSGAEALDTMPKGKISTILVQAHERRATA